VGDFTYNLAAALQKLDQSVDVVTSTKAGAIRNLLKDVREKRAILHIQYPTLGFGNGLTPQMVSLFQRSVVTIHELRRVNILRRIAMPTFWLRARHLVFTTEFEREYALRFLPFAARHSSVIPIGNTVPVSKRSRYRRDEVIYFGLIRPDKGLEQVIELARLSAAANTPFSVRIIGRPHSNHIPYYESLRQIASGLPIRWDSDRTDETVSDLLADAAFAYLPFPDGASERRSSLRSMLGNGVATVTTDGPYLPADLRQVVALAPDAAEAFAVIRHWQTEDGSAKRFANAGLQYMRRFSWEEIAAKHVELYEQLATR
jgi:glycosyltransferase involved in cell wall biosynthesis